MFSDELLNALHALCMPARHLQQLSVIRLLRLTLVPHIATSLSTSQSLSTAAPRSPSAMPPQSEEPIPKSAPILVFSGGTAFNSVAPALHSLTSCVTHVLPISDNGGSSREISRVIGGPAIGDVRSRLTRLVPKRWKSGGGVARLLNHRLTGTSPQEAEAEFQSILGGSHEIWGDAVTANAAEESVLAITEVDKQTLLAFMRHFQLEVQRCSRDDKSTDKSFDYRHGSLGNFVFSGARVFFGSLPTAVHWFSRLAGIPLDSRVLPIADVGSITLAATLLDGSVILGQDAISHPHQAASASVADGSADSRASSGAATAFEEATYETTLVDKASSGQEPLPSPVVDLFYVRAEESSTSPSFDRVALAASPELLELLAHASCICYAHGSLLTSIVPLLVVKGLKDAIAKHRGRKVLILNGHHDRETSHADYETVDGDSTTKRSCVHRLTASEVVWTIVNAIRSADGADDVQGGKGDKKPLYSPTHGTSQTASIEIRNFVTDVLCVEGSAFATESELTQLRDDLGLKVHILPAASTPPAPPNARSAPADMLSKSNRGGGEMVQCRYEATALAEALFSFASEKGNGDPNCLRL